MRHQAYFTPHIWSRYHGEKLPPSIDETPSTITSLIVVSEDKTKTKSIRLYFKGENIYIIHFMRALKVGILFLVGCASVEEKMRNLSVEYSISPHFNLDTVRTIAVFAKNDILYDAAVLNLLRVGKLDVVDRKRIDEILEEQEFGRSD
jgi:hypothetical protein